MKLDRLRAMNTRVGVLHVGSMPFAAIAFWSDAVTFDVVITGERRDHYLTRHPEILDDEPVLLEAILDPDEIHANIADGRMAIIYQQIDEGYFLRVAVWISNRDDRQNSVFSARRARLEEVEKGRLAGRLRWKK